MKKLKKTNKLNAEIQKKAKKKFSITHFALSGPPKEGTFLLDSPKLTAFSLQRAMIELKPDGYSLVKFQLAKRCLSLFKYGILTTFR